MQKIKVMLKDVTKGAVKKRLGRKKKGPWRT